METTTETSRMVPLRKTSIVWTAEVTVRRSAISKSRGDRPR